jgi:hypothetical protein
MAETAEGLLYDGVARQCRLLRKNLVFFLLICCPFMTWNADVDSLHTPEPVSLYSGLATHWFLVLACLTHVKPPEVSRRGVTVLE